MMKLKGARVMEGPTSGSRKRLQRQDIIRKTKKKVEKNVYIDGFIILCERERVISGPKGERGSPLAESGLPTGRRRR